MCNSIADMNDTIVKLPLQIDEALFGFSKWEGGYCEVRKNVTCNYNHDCNYHKYCCCHYNYDCNSVTVIVVIKSKIVMIIVLVML